MFLHRIITYLRKIVDTVLEWQWTVWKIHEKPRHIIPQAKKIPNTNFSCQSLGNGLEAEIGRRNMYSAMETKAINPIKCVHIFPVSVCTLNMLLKQNPKDGIGGLWLCGKKGLPRNQSGSSKRDRRCHFACGFIRTLSPPAVKLSIQSLHFCTLCLSHASRMIISWFDPALHVSDMWTKSCISSSLALALQTVSCISWPVIAFPSSARAHRHIKFITSTIQPLRNKNYRN